MSIGNELLQAADFGTKGAARNLKVQTTQEVLQGGGSTSYCYIEDFDLSAVPSEALPDRISLNRCVIGRIRVPDKELGMLSVRAIVLGDTDVGKTWEGAKNKSRSTPGSTLRDLTFRESVFVGRANFADVTVTAPERTYHKRCDVQTALGSLVGLMMATSGCPILSRMRPMARTHLPFSSVVETVFRTTSAYLLGQYLRSLDGETPDYSLVGLARLYEDLNTLNNAFAARLAGLADQDANLNAVSRLFSLSALVTMSVDGGLELVAPLFQESES